MKRDQLQGFAGWLTKRGMTTESYGYLDLLHCWMDAQAACDSAIKEKTMQYEIVKDKLWPDSWRVEAIGSDGEVYVAIFTGPQSKERAEEYGKFKSEAPR